MNYFSLGSISRNLLLLVIIAVLPAMALLTYSGLEQRKTAIQNARKDVMLMVRSMAEVQGDIARSCRQTLETLALLPEIRSRDLDAAQQILAAVLEKHPDYNNIALSDANGRVLAAGRPFEETSLADRKHVREALATGEFAAGEYILTRLGPRHQAFPFALPLLDKQGHVQGLLTAAINLQRFSDFYTTANFPRNSFVAVTDHRGIRLFYFPPKEDTNPLGKPIKGDVWDAVRHSADSGIFARRGSDGRKRIFAYAPVRLDSAADPYIYVWSGVPEKRIVAAANQTLQRTLLLMLLVGTVALYTAWRFGNRALLQPVHRLVAMTRNLAAGLPLPEPANRPRRDELDDLTAAFYEMARELDRQQQILLDNQARFRYIMDGLDALVYVADMQTYEILFINETGRQIFGDVTGQICWKSLQAGQTGPCPFCTNQDLVDADGRPAEIYTWEFRNTITGRWYYIHDRAIPWTDGRIVRLEIATDITERKMAETRLREESERLAVTLKSIGDGVISTDMQGRVLLLNQVAEKLTGWSSGAAAGQPLEQVFRLESASGAEPVLLKPGSPADQALPQRALLSDREGQKRHVSCSMAQIKDWSGEAIGSVLVCKDISSQLRTEQEMIKIKKLESIGVLAGGIAHDFNNILAAILGNIDLTLRDQGLGERSRHLLMQARNASFRARDLTQQLLTFAKGGQPIKETAALPEIVQDSAEFVLHGDKVACRYHFPGDLRLVDIDKGQISQVVQNMIINASSAMPKGGIINVSARNISAAETPKLVLAKAEQYVCLELADSGSGIPEHLLDKIFDPFFTTKQQGSGLGLAISHSIISKHGGAISVDSRPGAGTTFRIYLPAAGSERALSTDRTPVANGQNHRRSRVLVMDDEALVRDIAREMLQELGHEVLLAEDGASAVRSYRQAHNTARPIDLLIMDLTVPGGMGGEEAMQHILNLDPDARGIVSSGYSNDPVMSDYQQYGFAAAIVKPYQLDELQEIIAALLS